jgi:two-component system sensor histidine kinase BaeS
LVRNVLGNALRYTHSPGKIEVRVLPADNDGNVSLIIEDSAPGVPDASLERLFDRLYRVDISRNRAAGGAGLGLAICANIANGHGGTITASHSPLGGIRITVVLPHAGPDAPLGGPSPR